ncbi:PIN domain-containing protein [Candidatus Woesearchaeota archaeon]|nr:PIN domain-containing protein [Candidatus Woesearchaeota archaeon]
MEITTYFYDTYAFFEIIKGNRNYNKFSSGVAIVTTRLNLMELYYGLLVKFNKNIADKYYDELLKYIIDIDDETIKQAMVFRVLHKIKNLSYVDCVGYIIAKQRNIKFLTGDKEFKDLDNIEFVK